MKITILFLLFISSILVSLLIGPVLLSPFDLFKNEILARTVLNLRLTRTILGIIGGGMLAGCGVFLQGLLNNPLVEPYTLGTASGAALGSAFSILLFNYINPFFAFLGAIFSLITVYLFSKIDGRLNRERLILSGVVLSFLCSSLVMILMVLAGKELNEIIYLLMGNLNIVLTLNLLPYYTILILIIFGFLIILYLHSWELDIIASGVDTARSLGVNTEKLFALIFVLVSLIIAVIVSIIGAIGFVGLIIPHITRKIYGSAHRTVVPAAFLFGASFLLLADTLSRVLTPVELPVGTVTSLIGVPFFLFLQARQR
ncbi:MAG: iron ABC transporter permease [candidate division WOR-3 bacterium]